MTRDDIIRLCVEAGLYSYCDEKDEAIYRFAALVAEHERERIATSRPPGCRAAIARAREEERKACAEHHLGIMRDAVKQAREEEREAHEKRCVFIAKEVAAAERDACIKIVESIGKHGLTVATINAIRARSNT
jgi:hypothetical protein